MIAHTWLRAALAESPHVVCRLRLRPLSIGHLLLLAKVDSPFLDQKPANILDLLTAVLICSQNFSDGQKAIAAIDRDRFSARIFLRCWGMTIRKTLIHEEQAKFREYLAESFWFPATKEDVNQSTECASPWPLRMFATLRRHYHLSDAEALDYPLTRASVMLACIGEIDGTVDLFTEADAALFRAAREMDDSEEVA